ncbi:MATE family efflux transporter [Clostridium saccharoperbutylacetonicum]|uniref:MATE family efflux transporter n=1 Tax=Clostridium saccharoperbutylacetonicum TaxID=36745 RepID=UPI0039ED2DC5
MKQNSNYKTKLNQNESENFNENTAPQENLTNDNKVSFNTIIKITYPMIISMFSMNIMIFIDRAFVAKFNLTEFAATMPASNLATTIGSIFSGIIGYCAVLISQYYGAKRFNKCSSTIWQGIYLSLIFSILLLVTSPFTSGIFKLMGHSGNLLNYEVQFFYFIMVANSIQLFQTTFSCFYRAIGNTKIIMHVGIISNISNILLDWLLISGNLGFPKLGGIKGSGLATVISCIIGLLLYGILLNKGIYKKQFSIFSNKQFNKDLCFKLLRFGIPAGIQTFVSMGYYSFLLLIIGKTSEFNLSCANIAFTIEGISVLPVIGLATAVSVIVGHERGAKKTDTIIDIVKKSAIIGSVFSFIIIFIYNVFPETLISIFNNGEDAAKFLLINNYTVTLVKITSIWILFDTLQIIISNVLRSIGDTKFMMKIFTIIPFLFYILLPYALCNVLKLSLLWIWIDLFIYTLLMLSLVLVRLLKGKWKSINVI